MLQKIVRFHILFPDRKKFKKRYDGLLPSLHATLDTLASQSEEEKFLHREIYYWSNREHEIRNSSTFPNRFGDSQVA